MRRIPVFLLFPMFLGAADLTIDHVTVAGRDLKTMQANLAAVGIQTEYGGPHQNQATEMALAAFQDGSYLELIALQPNADAKAVAEHYWSKQLQGNAGPCAWAVRAKDMAVEITLLQTAGIAVSAPQPGGRRRPDGTEVAWQTARVGQEPNGTFFPFLIHDFTPRQARAFPSGKPTNRDFSGVTKVVIAVRDLGISVTRYRKAYGLQQPIEQVDASFGAHLALLGGTPVVLAEPLTSQSWLAARLDQFGEGPCAFILGAKKTGRYKASQKTRWFGADVSWLNPDTLGWHLGYEE